jgi:hypothetical protein
VVEVNFSANNCGDPDDAKKDDCPFFRKQLYEALYFADIPNRFGFENCK